MTDLVKGEKVYFILIDGILPDGHHGPFIPRSWRIMEAEFQTRSKGFMVVTWYDEKTKGWKIQPVPDPYLFKDKEDCRRAAKDKEIVPLEILDKEVLG